MRRLLVLVVACAALAGAPARVAAVDPVQGTPIPDEGRITTLADAATDVLPFDLDGDGVRELLVSGDVEAAPGFAAVEAWWIAADGSAERSNQVPVRRALSVDELYLGPATLQPDENGMIGTRIGEPAAFLVVQRDGHEVVLVATTGTSQSLGIVPCCLTIWELQAVDRGEISLALVATTQATGTYLAALDLDADGTDELVVSEATQSDIGAPIDLVLLRWAGSAYAVSQIPLAISGNPICCNVFLTAGDLDGVAGEELLMRAATADLGDSLVRLSAHAGDVIFDSAGLAGVNSARILLLGRGPALVTSDGVELALWEWPRDAPLRLVTPRNNPLPLLDVFGTGDDTLLLVGNQLEPDFVHAIPGDFQAEDGRLVSMPRDTRIGALNSIALRSSFGLSYQALAWPVPGGVPSASGPREAFVFSGGLIRRPASGDRPVVDPVALLPGQVLLGAAGPDLGWMAVWTAPEGGVLQPPQPGLEPHGGVVDLLSLWQPGNLDLIGTSVILEAEINQSALEPTFTGVAPDPERPASLLVGSEAVDAIVEGPPGTRVWWSSRGTEGQARIGPDGRATMRLLEPAGPDAPEGSGATPSIWAITPAGHTYHGEWRIRVFRQPPDLGLQAEVPIIDLEPTLSGRTLPGSTVTVNGQAVAVGANGSFATPIEVGFLPTELRVVVTDPVGNQTTRVVTRVWPFDYRQLPFVPIVVLVTVAVGLALFLRRPEVGVGRAGSDDDASFEEIGG